MRKNLILLFFAACSLFSRANAQDYYDILGGRYYELYSPTQKRFTFAFQPLQLLNYGFRFDVETRLLEGPGWLQFGPAAYFYPKINSGNPHYLYVGDELNYADFRVHEWLHGPFLKLLGGGMDVNYKHFFNPRRSLYLAAGLSYTHFSIEYWGYSLKEYIDDSLEYYSFELGNNTQYINRLGVNCFFGYQIPKHNAFICDMFVGLAYRYSFSDTQMPSFSKHMFSYGYSGIVVLIGVRLGLGIK